MPAFAELGLGPAITDAALAAGYDVPTPLQAAAIPVLRRGGNVVLHASSGAGVTAAFGLPLLDRLAQEESTGEGPRALVLAPTPERAENVARGVGALADRTGLTVRAMAPGWKLGGDIVVMTPPQALRAVQDSALKLEAVQTLVLLDASELLALGHGDTLDTLFPLVPRAAQRVVTAATLTHEIEKLVEAHARRALTVPPRPATPAPDTSEKTPAQIGYLVVRETDKAALVARLLESVEGAAVVFTRTAARAERVAADLARRGIGAARDADAGRTTPFGSSSAATAARDADAVRTLPFDSAGTATAARVVSYDVPFSAEQLHTIHANGGTVLVTPLEVKHLQRIAAEVPFTLKYRRARAAERDPLDAFRNAIRTALDTEDLAAQLLVLQPLLDEHSADEVAAALSALLRRRAAATTPPESAPAETAARRAAAAFTRLFVSIGSRDNVRPGDLVGAITGEANIKGDQVGRVDIRDTFSVVEVAAGVADRVIRALNGTTMRGRSLRVDYDRKSSGGEERRAAPRARRGPGSARGGASRREGPPRQPDR